MDVTATLDQGMRLIGTAQSGFDVVMDAGRSVGGENSGFRPLELMAISLAGCTGMDVISILRKKRQQVTDFAVTIHAERAEQHPKVFLSLDIHYTIEGRDVAARAVERAIQLSAERYCPAQAMLNQVVPTQTSYTIVETSEKA